MQYTRTELPTMLSIRSVTTIFKKDFSEDLISDEGGEVHSFCELQYVERGSYHVTLDGKDFCVQEGQMMVYAPNVFHGGNHPRRTDLADIIAFEAEGDDFSRLYNRVITLDPLQRKMISDIVRNGTELFKFTLDNPELVGMIPLDPTDLLELQTLKNRLELFFLSVYQSLEEKRDDENTYQKEQFERVVQYMRSNLSRTLTLGVVAKECSLSESKIKLLFKSEGVGAPMGFFISLKLDEAKRLIRKGAKNFTEISEALGFYSIHHFSRVFKQKVGMAPSEYAKNKEHL